MKELTHYNTNPLSSPSSTIQTLCLLLLLLLVINPYSVFAFTYTLILFSLTTFKLAFVTLFGRNELKLQRKYVFLDPSPESLMTLLMKHWNLRMSQLTFSTSDSANVALFLSRV